MLLRSTKQAIYDPENRGHFGPALQSMRTLPRRLPLSDSHRAIQQFAGERAREQGQQHHRNGRLSLLMEEMLQLGQHCSWQTPRHKRRVMFRLAEM